MRICPRNRLAPGMLILLVLAGCTTSHYRKSADRDSYAAIRQKTPLVPNMDQHFTIDQTNNLSFDRLSLSTNVEKFLGIEGKRERDARVLKLEDALDIAVHHSRGYQSRKEQLYLSALNLTLARHQFTPIFSGNASVDYIVQTEQAVAFGIDPNTGQPTTLVSDTLVETHSVSGTGAINASYLIRDVGLVTTAFTADALRFVSGDPRLTTSSQLSATFLRPLWRDANFKQEQEALTQAERQLLYDLRSFAQFRKDFSVQVATAFYGVLGNRDAVRNSYINLLSSRKNGERTRAMTAEGRTTTAELGRYEQAELVAEGVWINAVRNYEQSLDNFKFQLGVPVEANLILDEHELAALVIRHPNISVDDSINVALAGRLDYQNTKDQYDDTVRDVKVAANFLNPKVDFVANGAIVSNPNATGGINLPEAARYNWSAGLNVDPGFDRTTERNAYRAALIARNRAARDVEQQQDQVKLQVRDSWRTLDQARRNYEISDHSVKLAERRVEEQDLLAEVGRAKAQDQVDAQNDLISSQNQRTQALVTHTIARLQFWNNMGILYIKDNGQWEEFQNAKTQ